MLNFAKYNYNPATVEACQVTENNIVELSAIVDAMKLKIKPKVGEWVIKKESGMYEIWQNKAFERKFTKFVTRQLHPTGMRGHTPPQSSNEPPVLSAGDAMLAMAAKAFGGDVKETPEAGVQEPTA